MLLFYIRHGDPIYSPDSLTPLGLQQADAVAKRLAVNGLDRIYTSPSNRAVLTAKPTADLLEKEPVVLDWTNEKYAYRELSVTDEEGKRRWGYQSDRIKRLFLSPEVRALGDEWYTHPEFAGTGFETGTRRIVAGTREFLASLGYVYVPEKHLYRAEQPNEERVALFAHDGFGRAFLSAVLDIPYPQICTHFGFEHSSVTVISFHGKDEFVIPKVLQLSNDSHLYHEGLPTNYNNGVPI